MARTLDEIVRELRALRLERDKADARLLLRMVEIEETEMKVIAAAGFENFERFIKQTEIVDVARYTAFKTGLVRVGKTEAMKIGSHATIIAGKLTDGPDKFVKAVTDWKAEHGGTLPSRETAHTLLRQVDPRAEVPESSKRQDELAQVRAQLTEARAAIRTLEKENRDLKAKIAKLEKKMSRPQPRA